MAGIFGDIGAGVGDLFQADMNAQADTIKAEGDFAQAQEYTLASQLAKQNAAFTQTSTAIQEAQQSRQIYQTIGAQKAGVAGAGLSGGGSAGALLRSSAQQGALTQAVTAQQGLITEAGYNEQAQSYNIMAKAATQAGQQEQSLASETKLAGDIGAGFQFASAAMGIMALL